MLNNKYFLLLLLIYFTKQDCVDKDASITKLTPEQKRLLLKQHNDYRNKMFFFNQNNLLLIVLWETNQISQHPKSYFYLKFQNNQSTNEIIWNQELETLAQNYVNTCPSTLSTIRSTTSYTKPGENLFISNGAALVAFNDIDPVGTWFNQVSSFNHDNISPFTSSASTVYYEQLVYANVKRMGCGIAKSLEAPSEQKIFIVCNYDVSPVESNSLILYTQLESTETSSLIGSKCKSLHAYFKGLCNNTEKSNFGSDWVQLQDINDQCQTLLSKLDIEITECQKTVTCATEYAQLNNYFTACLPFQVNECRADNGKNYSGACLCNSGCIQSNTNKVFLRKINTLLTTYCQNVSGTCGSLDGIAGDGTNLPTESQLNSQCIVKLNTLQDSILECQKNDVCWNDYNTQSSKLDSCINFTNDLCTTNGKTYVDAGCVCNCVKSKAITNTLILRLVSILVSSVCSKNSMICGSYEYTEAICIPGQFKKSSSCYECNKTNQCLTCTQEDICTSCFYGSVLQDGSCFCNSNDYKTYFGNCEAKEYGVESFNYVKNQINSLSSYDLAINMLIASFSFLFKQQISNFLVDSENVKLILDAANALAINQTLLKFDAEQFSLCLLYAAQSTNLTEDEMTTFNQLLGQVITQEEFDASNYINIFQALNLILIQFQTDKIVWEIKELLLTSLEKFIEKTDFSSQESYQYKLPNGYLTILQIKEATKIDFFYGTIGFNDNLIENLKKQITLTNQAFLTIFYQTNNIFSKINTTTALTGIASINIFEKDADSKKVSQVQCDLSSTGTTFPIIFNKNYLNTTNNIMKCAYFKSKSTLWSMDGVQQNQYKQNQCDCQHLTDFAIIAIAEVDNNFIGVQTCGEIMAVQFWILFLIMFVFNS